MDKGGFLYILTNKHHTVFYTGVTANLERRIAEHARKLSGFTSQYQTTKLVYFEQFNRIIDAICREKIIKGKSRIWKILLIESLNPRWEDLLLHPERSEGSPNQ